MSNPFIRDKMHIIGEYFFYFNGGGKLSGYVSDMYEGENCVPNLLVVDEVVIRVNVDCLGGFSNVPVGIDLDTFEDNMNPGLEFFSRDRRGQRRVGR